MGSPIDFVIKKCYSTRRQPASSLPRSGHRAPNLAPAPAPAGLPAPPPSRAGRGRRATAPRARAGQRGLGSGRGFREVSPGRPRRSPWPDAQRGRDAFATGDRSHRRPGPLRPQPAFLPPRPPPPPAPHSRPRVLPTAPEPPAPSASQVSVAAARPGLPGREDRAGPGARRGSWAGGGGGGPSFLTPARPRDCGRGAPAPSPPPQPPPPPQTKRPRWESRGQPLPPRCLPGAAAARRAWAARVSPPGRPCSFLGERDPKRATGTGVNHYFPAGPVRPACGDQMWRPAPGRVPASSARGWLLCVAGDRPWPAGGGRRPETPGLQEPSGRLSWGVGAWLTPGMLAGNIPPAFAGVTKGRESGLAGISGWYLFLYVR